MKAITIRQPWATLIAEGIKDVENRPQRWATYARIAIHSGQTTDWDAFNHAHVQDATGLPAGTNAILGNRFLHGHVLAVAAITNVHQAEPGCCTSRWALPIGWHLVLRDVVRLERPVFARGRLGPWELPTGVMAAVVQQIGGQR